jgi:hypothetical protein
LDSSIDKPNSLVYNGGVSENKKAPLADTSEAKFKGNAKMNTQQNTTVKTTTQAPAMVWMVDYSAEIVNEVRTGTRSADGKWLKRNVKLTTKRRTSDFNEMLAQESYDNAA